MHEAVQVKCLFSCDAEDCLQHYLSCPVLAYAVAAATGEPLPIDNQSIVSLSLLSPLDRKVSVLRIFVFFHTYHSFKHTALREDCPQQAYNRAFLLAVAAKRKADTLGFRAGPADCEAASVLQTRFVQGGDHFITNSFTS